MEENKIKVYIKIDSNNCITNIDSSIFLQDTEGWIMIDEGYGDKYSHAQGMYFPSEKPLRDMQGRCNYKYLDNKIVELTDEEKEALYPPAKNVIVDYGYEKVKKELLNTQDLVTKLQEQIISLQNKILKSEVK